MPGGVQSKPRPATALGDTGLYLRSCQWRAYQEAPLRSCVFQQKLRLATGRGELLRVCGGGVVISKRAQSQVQTLVCEWQLDFSLIVLLLRYDAPLRRLTQIQSLTSKIPYAQPRTQNDYDVATRLPNKQVVTLRM
jgi:hypothetical protein